ncbi:MAG: PAS domain S-box protein [Desulfobacterales bacterium]
MERDSGLTVIWVKYKLSSIVMKGARVAIMTLDNITDRKQAQESLFKSEQHLRDVMDNMIAMIGVLTPDGTLIEANRTALQAANLKIEDVKGKQFEKCYWWSWSMEVQKRLRGAIQMAAAGQGSCYDEVIRVGEAKFRTIEFMLSPMFDPDGRVVSLIPSAIDITKRKLAEQALIESEKRFRTLVSATSEVLYRVSPDWSEMRQLHSRSFLVNTEKPNREWLSEYIHPDDQAHVTAAFNEAIRKKSVFELEHRVRRADGSFGWTFSRAVPLMDPNGKIVEWFGAASDITERKQAEEGLKQLKETLEQKVAERTALADTRAKQLQILSVELIEAEEKERRRIAELLHEDLQQILAGAKLQLQAYCTFPSETMLANLEQMLEESIKKSRQLSHELSPPMLYQLGLVAALKWLVQQMDEQFGLQVLLKIKTEQQFENESLKICVFRSVQELLLNVIKHAGVKSAHLILSGSGDNFVITVSDQGCGFDPDILNNSNNKVGFGLITIKERASYIGGNLTIESTPGKGSSFTLTIPLGISKENTLQVQLPVIDPESRTSEYPATSDSGKIRVLFADDHEVMRQGLIKLINGQPDIQVVGEAANGWEAFDQARLLKPDVVVMDVSMPEMNGIEATRLIKSELPEIYVIGLSMYEDELIVRAMSEAGAEGFVSKSAPADGLLKAIYGINRENKINC